MSDKRKVVLFIASSLDGYIATVQEQLDWLFEVEGKGDNGFSDFYQTVDTVLMGKKTYDWVNNSANIDEFPYTDKECYVFSRSKNEDNEHTKFIHQDLESFIKSLKRKQGKNIWLVGGGQLFNAFLEQGLVDELIITLAPKIIGDGIPLFNKGKQKHNLILKSVQTFNQFVELHYIVEKS